MNDRIKLPAQEWLGYDPERGNLHGYTFEQMREFAKSIIEDCVAAAEEAQADSYVINSIYRRFNTKRLYKLEEPGYNLSSGCK